MAPEPEPEPVPDEENDESTVVPGEAPRADEEPSQRATEAENRLLAALVEHHATALEDPSDLLRYVDADDVKDEDGFPSHDAIVTAAEKLAELRPRLARKRFEPIQQGPQSQPSEPDPAEAFSALLKGAAS